MNVVCLLAESTSIIESAESVEVADDEFNRVSTPTNIDLQFLFFWSFYH